MNKTVELVNAWANYAENHPEASLEEFCRYYLTTAGSAQRQEPNFKGSGVPPSPPSYLMKLIGYISRVFELYLAPAMADIEGVKQSEDFFFLNNISNCGECRKTEVTHMQLIGLSTGIDTLNRLLALELIRERPDPTDKRARLVSLTEKGRSVLHRCYQTASKVNEMIFHDMSADDIQLCIQLLRGVEIKHTALVHEMKEKTVGEIYEKICGRPME